MDKPSSLSLPELADSVAKHLRLLSDDGCLGFDCSKKTTQILERGWGRETLPQIRAVLDKCEQCSLHDKGGRKVFGQGDKHADIVFVGLAPGREEELCGKPFMGEAGDLLTNIIGAMGLTRESVYICNVVKCRVEQGQKPGPDQIKACAPFLKRQIAAIRPKVIFTLGEVPASVLLGDKFPVSQLREKIHMFSGIRVMPMYHPDELLHFPEKKRAAWQDMKAIMRALK